MIEPVPFHLDEASEHLCRAALALGNAILDQQVPTYSEEAIANLRTEVRDAMRRLDNIRKVTQTD